MNLEFVEQSLRIGPTSTNCSDAVHGEQRKKKESKARRREKWGMWRARERGVVDLAMPPTAEHAATFLDGHATASGGVCLHYRHCAAQGEAWGGRMA